jgi:parallel beta-helix repeat protein
MVLSGLLILAAPLAASAATTCVNPGGTGGCFTTFKAAIAMAGVGGTVQAAKGTYTEDVQILASVSIIGANPKNTIIDAAGLGNGFFVDGIDAPGLSNVVVSGFTVKNANFEGILVANASSVTVSNNIVSNNNTALVGPDTANPSCTGLPSFETSEDDDCGEGIHLLGSDHSIVANNVVQNNAGGILISDDTAIASSNFVTGNTVQKNSFDCGITMASHPRFGGGTPYGVLQNTITDNLSTQNGLAVPGAGAGVGIFDSVPGTTNSGNVVVGNTLTKNGLPGVTMHSHTPGQNLTNNVIVGNTISGNAADTQDAATSGPTGINVFGVSPASGTVISGNTISNESLDIVVNTPTSVDIHLNNLLGKNAFGVQNLNVSNGTADATQNYWGCPQGPPTKACSQIVPSTGITVFPVSSKRF